MLKRNTVGTDNKNGKSQTTNQTAKSTQNQNVK